MVQLNSFEAIRFRGIDGLSLPRLARANLVTGVNGVGKTALLEAIWLFLGRYDPVCLWDEKVQRSGRPVINPVAVLSSGEVELRGVENGSSHEFKVRFEQTSAVALPETVSEPAAGGLFQLRFLGRLHAYLDGEAVSKDAMSTVSTRWGQVEYVNPIRVMTRPAAVMTDPILHFETSAEFLKRYSEAVRERGKSELMRAINPILPRVGSVEILLDGMGEPYLSVMTKEGTQLPVRDLGSGAIRLFHLLLNFFASRGGVLLMDEMENGIHYSAFANVWGHVRQWMDTWNVQVVVTTHSAECIDAAIAAFACAPEDLSIHTLFRNDSTGGVEATTFSGEALEGARDLNLEVR